MGGPFRSGHGPVERAGESGQRKLWSRRSSPALFPRIDHLASGALERLRVASHHATATRAGDGGNQRVAQGQRRFRAPGDFSPDGRRTGIKIQDAILAWERGGENFDALVVGMLRVQCVEALPDFCQSNRGEEKMRGVLGCMPVQQARIGPGLARFADGVRVERSSQGHAPHQIVRHARRFPVGRATNGIIPSHQAAHGPAGLAFARRGRSRTADTARGGFVFGKPAEQSFGPLFRQPLHFFHRCFHRVHAGIIPRVRKKTIWKSFTCPLDVIRPWAGRAAALRSQSHTSRRWCVCAYLPCGKKLRVRLLPG